MFDLFSVIGLEEQKAIELLKKNGFDKINIKINSKHNDLCDTNLVCGVQENENGVTLVCGEFFLGIKKE